MMLEGVLTKMQTEFTQPINYYLVFKNNYINFNQLLDKKISIKFVKYECLNCHLEKPIYRQGFCKSCFFDIPQAADWIMKPELSKAHLDEEDRDLDYEKKIQLQPHIVYLANSSNIKVGVTRKSQVPTRWIDQGAHEAIEIVEVPNRYLAGITEVALKDHISDKTNWRKMLKNDIIDEELSDYRNRLKQYIPEEVLPYFIESNKETNIEFPVIEYPKKPKSLNLSKTPEYTGVLKGVKGQYLIFEDQTVFNVRANEGLVVNISIEK
ncbi:DUF2797 domain-containing protein [Galbibacter sp. EGI 63066]|uniref:DUF2797 domain-containing protein n=1 Tax=Galbibacter sp. EGI 63066 TaxID=2993559 RepID=UPI00224919BD|nr:DUF2797 domain-containing protein [Galbibacter sp. EGI 63066]MCX2681638.1 DUF2797 domain-containing protein [Galbibacter sp. EGI 63066]